MSLQTYSSIDWIAEAEKVRKAFGVEGEHYFDTYALRQKDGSAGLILPNNLMAYVGYDRNYRYFSVREDWTDAGGSYVKINWDGFCFELLPAHKKACQVLARAIFHLDLLTPEVEQALNVTIDAHTKMEWGLEYDRKYEATR